MANERSSSVQVGKVTVHMDAEAASGRSIESVLQATRRLRVLAQDMDAP
jgi:hypothetical protein